MIRKRPIIRHIGHEAKLRDPQNVLASSPGLVRTRLQSGPPITDPLLGYLFVGFSTEQVKLFASLVSPEPLNQAFRG